MKKQVILVTDGDQVAQQAVYQACKNLNLCPIMASGGNPTPLKGTAILSLITRAPFGPVVVMVDDRGKVGQGKGERVLEYLLNNEEIHVLGVVAVASNTKRAGGVVVNESVDWRGKIISQPVNKEGKPERKENLYLEGDTVEVLSHYPTVKVVGCGDLGKMEGNDDPHKGAMITTACFERLLE
ncbi:MAG: stage V sporulation protein AE [Chitinophagales bacterium]